MKKLVDFLIGFLVIGLMVLAVGFAEENFFASVICLIAFAFLAYILQDYCLEDEEDIFEEEK